MIFNVDDLWSPKMKALYEFSVLATTENSLYNTLHDTLLDILNDNFIATATETGIAHREELLLIEPFDDDTIESRRFRVGVMWNNAIPYTDTALRNKLTQILGADGYTFTRNYGAYSLTIAVSLGQKRMRDTIETMVTNMVPANLVITVTLLYNTYNDMATMTHDQMSAYTHDQLREEEL